MIKPYPPLCLWCEHFHFDGGSRGYSEWTPGSEFSITCRKWHWEWKEYGSEEDFRKCIMQATDCKDYDFKKKLEQSAGSQQE